MIRTAAVATCALCGQPVQHHALRISGGQCCASCRRTLLRNPIGSVLVCGVFCVLRLLRLVGSRRVLRVRRYVAP